VVRMKTNNSSSNSVGCRSVALVTTLAGCLDSQYWTWVNYQDGNTSSIIEQSYNPGTTLSLELFGNQSGISVDQVILLTDSTCNPNNEPTNYCTSSQPATPGSPLIPSALPGDTGSGPPPSTQAPRRLLQHQLQTRLAFRWYLPQYPMARPLLRLPVAWPHFQLWQ